MRSAGGIAQAPAAIVATPISAPLYYGGHLSTLSPDQASSYGDSNHPPNAVVSVRQGLPDLRNHYGIVVDDYRTYGIEHWTFEFDLETGTVYEQLVFNSGSPQSVYRIVPPAQGGDVVKYREILQ